MRYYTRGLGKFELVPDFGLPPLKGIIAIVAAVAGGIMFLSDAFAASDQDHGKWCGREMAIYDEAVSDELPFTFTGTIAGGVPNWRLRLDYTTPVQRLARQGERSYQTLNVQELQLRGAAGAQSLYKDFVGRHVSIAGKLKAASGASDSDIVLEAEQIQSVGPTSCDGQLLVPKT